MQEHTLQYLNTEKEGCFLPTIHIHSNSTTELLCNSEGPSSIALISTINKLCSYNLGDGVMCDLVLCNPLSGLLLLTRAAMCSDHYMQVEVLVSK